MAHPVLGRAGGGVEPFVRRIVAGGLALVAGLWVLALLDPGSAPWFLGPVLVFGGGASLLSGIARPLPWGGDAYPG